MKSKYVTIIIILLIIAIGGYFFLKGNYKTAPTLDQIPTQNPTTEPIQEQETNANLTETQTAPLPSAIQPATESVSKVKEIIVNATEFSFSPASISVKAGEKVKITFNNNGKYSHNLTIDKLGLATRTINAGQTDVVEFTAPSLGIYAFFCSISGHRELGMKGDLNIIK